MNVDNCAVLVCKEDKKNPLEFKWKWGEEEVPVADHYTYASIDISKNCSWDTHIHEGIEKGKADMGKMGVMLRNSHLDTRMKRYILENVIVP